jgi:hypothetical protein
MSPMKKMPKGNKAAPHRHGDSFYKNRQPASSAFLLLPGSSFAISGRASSVIALLIANDIAPGGTLGVQQRAF